MNVKELKEELANLPDDSEIYIMMDSGCCGEIEYLEISMVDSYEPRKEYNGSLNIRCNPLPGYESCRSSRRMDDLAKEIQKERDERNGPKKDD